MKNNLSSFEKRIRDFYTSTFANMKSNSRNRNHPDMSFTKKEFIQWFKSQNNYAILWNNYLNSGGSKELKPTVDRIDDRLGYSLGNMQLLTWADNRAKQVIRQGKPITQLSLSGKLINRYASRGQAARSTGIRTGNIFRALNDGSTAGGFRWEYVNLEY